MNIALIDLDLLKLFTQEAEKKYSISGLWVDKGKVEAYHSIQDLILVQKDPVNIIPIVEWTSFKDFLPQDDEPIHVIEENCMYMNMRFAEKINSDWVELSGYDTIQEVSTDAKWTYAKSEYNHKGLDMSKIVPEIKIE